MLTYIVLFNVQIEFMSTSYLFKLLSYVISFLDLYGLSNKVLQATISCMVL